MRRFDAIPVLLTAVLLAGCQASGNSTSANEGKQSGGIWSVLRPDPITVPEGTTFPLVLETGMSSAASRAGDLVVARLAEDIKVGEKVVVPSGSEIRGRVTGGAAGTGVVLTNTGKEVELGTGSRVTVRLTREARL
jgi:hypothetical protein